MTDDAADAHNELVLELEDADALPEPAGLWDVCNWSDGIDEMRCARNTE